MASGYPVTVNDQAVSLYVNQGLGCGIDARLPDPVRSLRRPVVAATPENVVQRLQAPEQLVIKWTNYTKSQINSELTSPQAPVTLFGLGLSCNYNTTTLQSAIVEKKITQRVQLSTPLVDVYNFDFVERFYSQLNQVFLQNRYESTETIADMFERFVETHHEKEYPFIREMLEFVRDEKVTHYITSIDLGAAEYFMYESSEKKLEAGGKAEVPVPNANLDAQAKFLKVDIETAGAKHKYGVVNSVQPFCGEGLIESTILPIDTLIECPRTRSLLHIAIKLYIGGCFRLRHNNAGYLHLVDDSLVITEDPTKVSVFQIIPSSKDPSYFTIVLLPNDVKSVHVTSRFFGEVDVEAGKATPFELRSMEGDPVGISDWTEGHLNCLIKVGGWIASPLRSSFLGVEDDDEEQKLTLVNDQNSFFKLETYELKSEAFIELENNQIVAEPEGCVSVDFLVKPASVLIQNWELQIETPLDQSLTTKSRYNAISKDLYTVQLNPDGSSGKIVFFPELVAGIYLFSCNDKSISTVFNLHYKCK